MSLFVSVFLSVFLSVCLSVCLSFCLSVCLSILRRAVVCFWFGFYLPVCLSEHVSYFLSVLLSFLFCVSCVPKTCLCPKIPCSVTLNKMINDTDVFAEICIYWIGWSTFVLYLITLKIYIYITCYWVSRERCFGTKTRFLATHCRLYICLHQFCLSDYVTVFLARSRCPFCVIDIFGFPVHLSGSIALSHCLF